MCVECNLGGNFVCVPLSPSINLKHLNLKNVVDRRKNIWNLACAFHGWKLAASYRILLHKREGYCSLLFFWCGVELSYWTEGDDALKEHKRWSPSCGLGKVLWVGNIHILSEVQPKISSQQHTRSRDECGSHFELRPNSLPERSKYYYLYFLICYACVFCYYAQIVNVLLQLQVPEHLKTW